MGTSKQNLSSGFDFTGQMRQVCEDVVLHLDELSSIDLSRVAISFSQTRKNVLHGLWATTTPMRFKNGSLTTNRRGRRWTVQRLYDSAGREMLYAISFYMPRFMNLTYREKLTTVVHELWHISPEFNGDLRRFAGRCYAHGSDQKNFDAQVEQLTDLWLSLTAVESKFEFLKLNFSQLHSQFGPIRGVTIRTPKLIPLESVAKKQSATKKR